MNSLHQMAAARWIALTTSLRNGLKSGVGVLGAVYVHYTIIKKGKHYARNKPFSGHCYSHVFS